MLFSPEIRTNGSLSHSVYREPTHTDRYLNYRTFHHPAIKSSVCRTLVHRAHSIGDDESIGKELDHIKDVLKNNGFPDKKILLNAPKPTSKIDNNSTDLVKSVYLPYICPASHRIERILRLNNIKVYHSSNQKIHQILFSHKDKTGVYRIPCECGLVYIGETGRNLTIRQKEHHNCCVKEKCEISAIAKHAWTYDHRINWDKSVLLAPVDKYFAWKTRESIEISKHRTIPQEGKSINNIWTSLFN